MDKMQGSTIEFVDFGLELVVGNTDDLKMFSLVTAIARDLDPQDVWKVQLSGRLMELHSRNMLADEASVRLALDFIVQSDRARLTYHAVLVKADGKMFSEIAPLVLTTRAIALEGKSKETAMKEAGDELKRLKAARNVKGHNHITITAKSKIEEFWKAYKPVIHYLDAVFSQSLGNPVPDPLQHSQNLLQKLRDAGQPLDEAITIKATSL